MPRRIFVNDNPQAFAQKMHEFLSYRQIKCLGLCFHSKDIATARALSDAQDELGDLFGDEVESE